MDTLNQDSLTLDLPTHPDRVHVDDDLSGRGDSNNGSPDDESHGVNRPSGYSAHGDLSESLGLSAQRAGPPHMHNIIHM